MIKKILLNVPNKVKAIYLLWILINLSLLFLNTKEIVYAVDLSGESKTIAEGIERDNVLKKADRKYNLPETKNSIVFSQFKYDFSDFDYEKKGDKWIIPHTKVLFPFTSPYFLDMEFVAFYDITEFLFYSIIPIIIYIVIKLFTTKDKPNE